MKFLSRAMIVFCVLLSNFFCGWASLSEWTNLCFSKYREYSGRGNFNEPKSVITKEQFRQQLNKFSELSRDELKGFDFQKCRIQKIDISAESEVCFIGDIHGSIHSLLRNLWRLVSLGDLDNNFKIKKNNFYMVFLGDYVDYGRYGVEVLSTLLSLKLANWKHVFLLRGNHEITDMNMSNGFFDELGSKSIGALFMIDAYFYKYLTHALFIRSGSNNSCIQCCHGGIIPEFKYYVKSLLEDDVVSVSLPNKFELNNLLNWLDFRDDVESFGEDEKTKRPFLGCKKVKSELSDQGLMGVFRGHQHFYFGLKIGGEQHWTNFIKDKSEFLLTEAPWPIFTFSTAAEGASLPYDCFGILTTADKFEDWKLKPFEYRLAEDRNNKFVSISKADGKTKDLFKINWSESPVSTIICEELLHASVASRVPEEKAGKKEEPKIASAKQNIFSEKLGHLCQSLDPIKVKISNLLGQLNNLRASLAEKN